MNTFRHGVEQDNDYRLGLSSMAGSAVQVIRTANDSDHAKCGGVFSRLRLRPFDVED
jgi:hypothetical protein